jgi:hypothetical protein
MANQVNFHGPVNFSNNGYTNTLNFSLFHL